MKGFLSWNDVATEKKSKKGGNDEYLWLKSGNKYRVRTVHKAVHFFKYFVRDNNGKLRTALTEDPNTCPVAASHPGLKERASERYAIYVIDRADGKLKIMEGPKSVFMPMRKRFEVSNKDPGGSKSGGDWLIEIEGSGKNTTYTSTYIEDTPLTEDEVKMISEAMKGNEKRLLEIYEENTPEEIEKRLFAPWDKAETTDKNYVSENDFGVSAEDGSSSEEGGFDLDF